MAFDKAVDSTALNAGLTKIADAIRAKGGTSGTMAFPDGFAELIEAISGGRGELFDIVASGEIIPSDNITGEYTIETGFSEGGGTRGWGAAIFCAAPYESEDLSRIDNRLVFSLYLPIGSVNNTSQTVKINAGYGNYAREVGQSPRATSYGRIEEISNTGDKIYLESLAYGGNYTITLKAGERYKWAIIRPYMEES